MAKYNAKEVEDKIRKFWAKEKIYKFDPKSKKEVYSIDTPPPYISGRMHIGHAFSYSQQDFIIRYMRMKGMNIFYPFGTDDNGLPTERFIEKTKKVKSKDLGRTEFIKLCQKTLEEVTPTCIQDFIDLGISSDYELYYSTIDRHSQKISQKSFIDLYNSGDLYKKNYPTMWCPECQTSIAQAELEDKESGSLFSTIKFSCEGKDLLIATTRPELLGACVAVFVPLKDKNYKNLVGKKAKIPLFDYEVPIFEDKSADPEKGTGVMMVCSYGDKFDVEAIQKYKLSPKIIFEKDGTLNLNQYKGLKIKEARKKILEDLKENNLIKEQKQIQHTVNCHDKCGTAVEFLPTPQWFIKLLNKRKDYLDQADKISWYPKFMHKRYENWVNGLEWDWSISRNRHFGIPIPVWECLECNEVILPKDSELPVDPLETKKKCPKCKKDATPEKMVLDTWATSSLTPQIAAELPGAKGKVNIPFSLRPNAHDIIRTWAFYTIVKSHLHEKKIPWKDIVISGIVSLGGEKMSKSKGNIVDPIKVMELYGSDALRFWAAGSKLGNDLDYFEKEVMMGKKFVTKLLNASKFVFMNLEDYKGNKPKKLNLIDQVFLEKLNKTIKEATAYFEKYEYSKSKSVVEQFFWKDFADNYIEIVKKRVYQGEGESKLSAQYTLYKALLEIIKMIAPITPFITEEIYQTYFKKFEKEKSIHISEWPKHIKNKGDKNNLFELFIEILTKIRTEKSNSKKAMNAEIILTLPKEDIKKFEEVLGDIKDVMNASEIKEGKFGVEFK
ncbi:valine--tRNA ligase [Candidatus Pacearchaeota archaeon]|nr:valine--tRNA ligase [Candidatus Pacearchaeota archaeon]